MARVAVFVAAAFLAFLASTEVAAKKWTVGDNKFWNPNINYTIWAQDKHFYLDDWLCTLSLSLYLSHTLGFITIDVLDPFGKCVSLII